MTNSKGVDRFPGRVDWRRTRPIRLRMAEWRPRKRTLAEPDADRLTGKQLIRVSVERPSTDPNMRKAVAIVVALLSVLAGCSRPWQTSSVDPAPLSPDPSYAPQPRAGAYGGPPWAVPSETARSTEPFAGAPPPPPQYADQYGEGARSLDPNGPDPYAGEPRANEYDQASPSNPYGPVMRPGPQYQ
jgi:hypothetical protein